MGLGLNCSAVGGLIFGFVGLWCMLSKSKSTTHLEKISNPEWNQVYAFSKILFRLRWVWLCMEAENLGLSFVFFVFGFKA